MKKITAIFIALSVAVVSALVICDAVKTKPLTSSFFSMNTYCSAEVNGKNAQESLEEIESIVERLDYKVLSRTAEGSIVYNLNKNGETLIDTETAAYISLLADISNQSGGAFDFTLGAVSDLWSFGNNPSIPDSTELARALSHSGFEKVTVADGKAVLQDKQAVVDFGASGKGIALDSIKSYLETHETKRAVVSIGGSVLLYGKGDFTVGIRNPKGDSGNYIATIKIPEGCISTSGSYEQYFEENGKRYHHILDPETGYPVDNGLVSVTIISESGLLSDALSTACFVLGIEKGAELAESYGAKAVFITEDNIIHTDEETKTLITVNDGSYSF